MRHPFFPADLVELFEAQQREKHSSGPIGAHDLVFTGALRVGGDDGVLGRGNNRSDRGSN